MSARRPSFPAPRRAPSTCSTKRGGNSAARHLRHDGILDRGSQRSARRNLQSRRTRHRAAPADADTRPGRRATVGGPRYHAAGQLSRTPRCAAACRRPHRGCASGTAAGAGEFPKIPSSCSRPSRRNPSSPSRTPGCSARSRKKAGSSKLQASTSRSFSPR